MVEIRECEAPVSESLLSEVEKLIGVEFPQDYRSHLLAFNGGQPRPSGFAFTEHGQRTRSRIDWFLAVHDGEYDNLLQYAKRYKLDQKRVPTRMLPIAHDPGGNLLLVSCEGRDRGAVYFWDHEKEVDYEVESDTNESNVYFVAEGITGLLENLE